MVSTIPYIQQITVVFFTLLKWTCKNFYRKFQPCLWLSILSLRGKDVTPSECQICTEWKLPLPPLIGCVPKSNNKSKKLLIAYGLWVLCCNVLCGWSTTRQHSRNATDKDSNEHAMDFRFQHHNFRLPFARRKYRLNHIFTCTSLTCRMTHVVEALDANILGISSEWP